MPFAGQVMKATVDGGAVTDSYAHLDVPSNPDESFTQFDVMFTAADLTTWQPGAFSPDFMELLTFGMGYNASCWIQYVAGAWKWACGNGTPAGSVAADTVYAVRVESDVNAQTVKLYVNGSLTVTSTDTLSTLDGILIGLAFASDPADAYYDNVLVSAISAGGSELLANDFEASIAPPFTAEFGDVSLVPDPGGGGGSNPLDPFGLGAFYEAPPWRFIVTDLDSVLLTFLDRLAFDRSIVFTRGQPTVITCSVPSDNPEVNIPAGSGTDQDTDPFVAEGRRLLYCLRREGGPDTPWVIRAAGLIQQLRDNADSDVSLTQIVAFDGRRLLWRRPIVVDYTGALPDEEIAYADPGSTILIEQLDWMDTYLAGEPLANAGLDWGQTAFYTGTIETTDAINIKFARGVSIGEMIDALEQTGTLDVVIRAVWDPINRPGITGELSIYVRAGSPQYDAVFGYDCWPRSLVGIDRLIDGVERVNDVQFYAGQGGLKVTPFEDQASIDKYGRYFAQQFFPGQLSLGAVELMALRVLALQANGQRTYTLNPAAERAPIPFLEYACNDTVRVCAKGAFRQDLDEMLRVESMPIVIGDDQLERIQGLLVAEVYEVTT